MASSLTVHSGQMSWAWQDFMEQIQEIKNQLTHYPQFSIIQQLHQMRDSRYHTRDTYNLSSLLTTFQDAFCRDPRDKIYSFLSMASDVSPNDIPINYSKSIKRVYQDTFIFFQLPSVEPEKRQITMVYFSALIRQLLNRKSHRTDAPKPAVAFDRLERPWGFSALYSFSPTEAIYETAVNFVTFPARFLRSYLSAPAATIQWYQNSPEDFGGWQYYLQSSGANGENFNVRGSSLGRITHLGPTYSEIISSSSASKTRAVFLNSVAQEKSHGPGPNVLRGRNVRLQHILADPSKPSEEAYNVANLPARLVHHDFRYHDWSSFDDDKSHAPRLFLCENGAIGLVPSKAQVGDRIIQFWNSTTSAVEREPEYGDIRGAQIVGRAGVVNQGDYLDWDVPTDWESFTDSSVTSVTVSMSLSTLTFLSLNALRLPAT